MGRQPPQSIGHTRQLRTTGAIELYPGLVSDRSWMHPTCGKDWLQDTFVLYLYNNSGVVASADSFRTDGGHGVEQLTLAAFKRHIRDAMSHLRDPNFLRDSPLMTLFGLTNRHDSSRALRRVLIDSIEALRPDDMEPSESHEWRYYEALYYGYVRGSSQLEIASQLGLSDRQVRREIQGALEVLANSLWRRFVLQGRAAADDGGGGGAQPLAMGATVRDEAPWLSAFPPQSPANLGRELSAALELARTLSSTREVHIETELDGQLPELAVDSVALRQALLSILSTVVVHVAKGSLVLVSTRTSSTEVEIRVSSVTAGCHDAPADSRCPRASSTAQELASMCRGKLSLYEDEMSFMAVLSLPAAGHVPVLVIDDNPGALSLLQRYTYATRYQIFGTQHPERVLSLVEETAPRVIVLDVMMPNTDGWTLLGRLLEHPLVGDIPVIVCTILDEKELALALGASGFLRKPVSRQDFLSALDLQIAEMESANRSRPECMPADDEPKCRRLE